MQRVSIRGATRWTVAALALLAGVLLLGTALAASESTTTSQLRVVTPVFHQLVAFSLPAEFKSTKATSERTNGAFYLREQVPEGETLDKWSRMVSLSGTRDLASNPNATPQAMLARMTAGFQRNCPDTFSSAAPGAQTIDGYAAYEVIVSCGHVQSGKDAFSESAVMLTIKGTADYYTLQWAERGRDSPHPLALDVSYWSKQLAGLSPFRLCPIVPGEAAPYPSCAR
jgi:hypothetical protein